MDWLSADTSSFPPLEDDQLHLWWLPLTLSESQTECALNWISDIQRDRYARREAAGSQDSYLAGRYYLLQLLGAYTSMSPDQVMLSYSRLNKPYLSDRNHIIEFNFTDTKEAKNSHGLFAFSKNRELGVDIEALDRRSDFVSIAERRFTAQELEFVGSPFNPERFLAIWTRKEAYGKATGKGINFKMNQRNLVQANAVELGFIDDENRPWQLAQISLGTKLISSLVYAGTQRLEIKTFSSLNQRP